MSEERNLQIESLLNQYQTALKNGVTDDALNFGEKYFAFLRNGELTQEDKEQLQNDVMNSVTNIKKE